MSLPTSRVLYFADKVIESCALMLKYRNIKVCLSSDEAGARLKNSVAQTLPEFHISRVFSFFRVLLDLGFQGIVLVLQSVILLLRILFSFSGVQYSLSRVSFSFFRVLFSFFRVLFSFSGYCSVF